MRIVDIRASIAALPRSRSLKTAYGEKPCTTIVVAQIDTDEGITGIGQTVAPAPWYGDTAEAIKINILKYLRPAVVGLDPFDIERLFATMYAALRGGRYAITAVEYALWDLKGKALGLPVYQLLGGRCQAGAPLHAFVERLSAAETAERVSELADAGWTWFKTKIGFGVDEDLAWYADVRERVGDRARFQVDGNTGYTLGEAVHALTQLERLGGLALIEQPVHHLDEMAVLVSRLTTPIQADEALTGPRSVYDIATHRAAHVLHLKIHKYGGLLQAKRMAAIAEAAGLELSVAPYPDIDAAAAAHCGASTPNVKWPAGASDMADTILVQPVESTGQVLHPPPGPGFGVEIDQSKLAHFDRAFA
jgi:L-alanine-DL-glutamate epimerase-like enolase superfamily enzyme